MPTTTASAAPFFRTIEAVCPRCGVDCTQLYARTADGAQRYTCTDCGREHDREAWVRATGTADAHFFGPLVQR